MSKPKVVVHPPKPWQESLLQKLQGPSNDREVIFVIDLEGNAGKTYFTNVFEQEYGKSYTVGADKRDGISLILITRIIEDGHPT